MKDDKLYILHISECIEKIQSYTGEGYEKFLGSSMAQDAVIRNFEIMGEAAKKLSSNLKDRHPEIPWRRIAGLRDILIHDYIRVDIQEVWNIVEREIPKLESQVEAILKGIKEENK